MIRRASSSIIVRTSCRLRQTKCDTNVVMHPSRKIRLSGQTLTTSGMKNTYYSMTTGISQQSDTLYAKEVKLFSTTAASSNTLSSQSSSSSSQSNQQQQQSKSSSNDNDDDKSKKKKDDSNIFLDNLGKIFLSTIGIVLFMLLRSTQSGNSRTALREDIESTSLLDPLEIEDLRIANSDFTIDIWYKIVNEIKKEFPNRNDKITYPEFLSVVMRVMRGIKGEGFTIQFGHLVDRVVVAELERIGTVGGNENECNDSNDGGDDGQKQSLMQNELPLSFLYAALSLALYSTVADRVRALYEIMLEDDSNEDISSTTIAGEQVAGMIQHLQNTCQLVPEAQIVETNSKIPYQTYRVGTGDELTRRAREGYGGKKGSVGVTAEKEGPVSLEEFHAILKSRTVCAWGECYVKKSSRTATSDQ